MEEQIYLQYENSQQLNLHLIEASSLLVSEIPQKQHITSRETTNQIIQTNKIISNPDKQANFSQNKMRQMSIIESLIITARLLLLLHHILHYALLLIYFVLLSLLLLFIRSVSFDILLRHKLHKLFGDTLNRIVLLLVVNSGLSRLVLLNGFLSFHFAFNSVDLGCKCVIHRFCFLVLVLLFLLHFHFLLDLLDVGFFLCKIEGTPLLQNDLVDLLMWSGRILRQNLRPQLLRIIMEHNIHVYTIILFFLLHLFLDVRLLLCLFAEHSLLDPVDACQSGFFGLSLLKLTFGLMFIGSIGNWFRLFLLLLNFCFVFDQQRFSSSQSFLLFVLELFFHKSDTLFGQEVELQCDAVCQIFYYCFERQLTNLRHCLSAYLLFVYYKVIYRFKFNAVTHFIFIITVCAHSIQQLTSRLHKQKNHTSTLNYSRSFPILSTAFKDELYRFTLRYFSREMRWFYRSMSLNSILFSLSTTIYIFSYSCPYKCKIFSLGSFFRSICADSFQSCSWTATRFCNSLGSQRFASDSLKEATGVRLFLGKHWQQSSTSGMQCLVGMLSSIQLCRKPAFRDAKSDQLAVLIRVV